MADPLKKILEPIKELQNIRGIDLPIGLEFLQLVVTGPPGAGKSHYIEQIRGYPNEGYLDLTQKGWWKDQSLVFRPREVHLGLPFHGIKEAVTVFDKEWLNNPVPPQLECARIKIPPLKKYFFQTNWRERYIFEFLIPSPTTIYEQRLARQSQGYFPVDENLSLEMVRNQVAVYREVALYLHRAGINVYIRKSLDKPPMVIAEKGVATVRSWTLDRKPRRPSLKTAAGWKWLFHRRNPIEWLTLENQPQDLVHAGCIAHDGRSFRLLLGESRLLFQPEIPLGIRRKAAQKNWIINTEQGCATRNLNGFIRIRVGETIVIGQVHKDLRELFQFGEDVAKRHVSVTNRKGDLIITPLVADRPTRVMRHDDLDYREQLERGRHKTLLRIKRIFGQAIAPFPPDRALQCIRDVNRLLQAEPNRPLDRWGKPGGLVEIADTTTPVIVGDLHAQVNNLLKILSENCLLDCLRMKTATLIILGDAVHSEMMHELTKFESSMLIMDLIFRLKLTFPENVFYLRGNHDSFSPEIVKSGVFQGELFKEHLMKVRGSEYVREMQTFYESLPYIILSGSFIACHAGPPHPAVNEEDLINIRENDNLAHELTTTRLHRPHFPHGVEAAAQTYFGKNAARLTLGECALLAGLPQAPSRYSLFDHRDRAVERQKYVLNRMAADGYVSPEEAQAAYEETIVMSERSQQATDENGYYLEVAKKRARAMLGVPLQTAGAKIFTNLDSRLQANGAAAVRRGVTSCISRQLLAGKEPEMAPQGGLVCIETATGRVRALIGGTSFTDSPFDRATQARRPAGSTFKPFVYAAALTLGWSPESPIEDSPLAIGRWRPQNYSDKYHGMTTLAEALAFSLNTATVRIIQRIGYKEVHKIARNAGIRSHLPPDLSLALGTTDVSILEMTAAYTPFAGNGIFVEPSFLEKVVLADGTVLYPEKERKRQNVLNPAVLAQMRRMLKGVTSHGTGRLVADVPGVGGGKTGTSDDNRDAWFVGYDDKHTTGIWIGNDRNQPMGRSESGGTTAAPIWRDFMLAMQAH